MFYGIPKYDNKTEWEKSMNEKIGEEADSSGGKNDVRLLTS